MARYIALTLVYRKENGIWTAECEELGAATYGDTFEEAEASLKEVVEPQLNTLEKYGECERSLSENHVKIYNRKPAKGIRTEHSISPGMSVNRNIVLLPAC